ncbi:MAG: hypothetical protein ACKO9W_04660, partial [Bacteroidota bacterium]
LLQWGEDMEAQRLEWRDAGGRMIYNNDFTNPSCMENGQERQARVLVAQWSPGLYYGTLTLRDGRRLRFKLMVQP